jgi:hypothetical protein
VKAAQHPPQIVVQKTVLVQNCEKDSYWFGKTKWQAHLDDAEGHETRSDESHTHEPQPKRIALDPFPDAYREKELHIGKMKESKHCRERKCSDRQKDFQHRHQWRQKENPQIQWDFFFKNKTPGMSHSGSQILPIVQNAMEIFPLPLVALAGLSFSFKP